MEQGILLTSLDLSVLIRSILGTSKTLSYSPRMKNVWEVYGNAVIVLGTTVNFSKKRSSTFQAC